MKKKSSISLGPGASSLILIFVVLAMTVLGMLSLMNSRNDIRLSERSVQVAEAIYGLNVQAEEKRAELEALLSQKRESAQTDEAYLENVANALPEEITMEGDVLSWSESDGFRTLSCALKIDPLSEGGRTRWVKYRLVAETEDEWEEEW
ncbi:MAG: hypothetical protein IKQ41_11265 [Clostridia bacterium]|nr:hypothetical protein [Clostridia bacterium]